MRKENLTTGNIYFYQQPLLSSQMSQNKTNYLLDQLKQKQRGGMGNNCSIDIGPKEGARKPPPVQTLHILQCLPFLPTRSPYQDLENKKKWENRSRKLWVRALPHCMTPGDIINLIVKRMVPSDLEQCTICPAGHGVPGETRVLAR